MYYTYIQNIPKTVCPTVTERTDGIEISTLLPLRRRIGCAIARIIRTGSQNLLNAFQYVKFIFCATNPILALGAFPCVSANMPWYIIFRIKE